MVPVYHLFIALPRKLGWFSKCEMGIRTDADARYHDVLAVSVGAYGLTIDRDEKMRFCLSRCAYEMRRSADGILATVGMPLCLMLERQKGHARIVQDHF